MHILKRTGTYAILAAALGGCGVLDLPGGNADGGGGGGIQPKFSSLYAAYLGPNCKGCHAPMAPGRTKDTEATLDFTSGATAYMTITTGKAAGLAGNFAGCNGVSFVIAGKPGQSLLVASVDQATRKAFDSPTVMTCDDTAISDMTLKGGAPPAGFVTALKDWVTAGAKND